jgi:hypothetical protein
VQWRFLNNATAHLTKRDEYANDLEEMFDFDHSPSQHTAVGVALPPADDCTPVK